jgi:hypothetical protein
MFAGRIPTFREAVRIGCAALLKKNPPLSRVVHAKTLPLRMSRPLYVCILLPFNRITVKLTGNETTAIML